MAASEDLINFDVIEGQKENIQSLPGGRSAKKLVDLYSPSPLHKLATPTPTDTKNVNDCIRAEYEAEIQGISESDDPLDVFDRYVRWTLDAYPSAQATPQSQLHTLLERATKTFISSAQYKNDPRYLRLWLHYIQFFSDAPREMYMYLSRHGVGEGLALFYEEYAAWLEGAGRFAQAEEVYKLGIEREARPVQRLLRKFKEFEERAATQRPDDADGPSSPALPTVRPALAAKVDPFGASSSATPADPQAPRPNSGVGGSGSSRPTKSKLAIFSDADAKPAALSSRGAGSKGWDTIGSLSDRKKENVMEAKPWVGETLKAGGAGGKKADAPKLAVFRDPNLSKICNIVVVPSQHQVTVHPQTGKKERIFVDLAALYPTPDEQGTELSFEEIMAARRGWLNHSWHDDSVDFNSVPEPALLDDIDEIGRDVVEKLVVHKDEVMYDENGAVKPPPAEARPPKKKKVMEVNETQIIKAKLDSPSGPKLRKKNTSEPTMTIHTKAATDDIYEIFNAPLKSVAPQEEESADEDDYETDGDYTTDAESTGTTRQVEVEAGVEASDHGDDETSDVKSVSEWSDFSTGKHVPNLGLDGEVRPPGENGDSEAKLSASDSQIEGANDPAEGQLLQRQRQRQQQEQEDEGEDGDEALVTPVEEEAPRTRTSFIPLPPEDYEPPTRPYRDPVEVANNRLPFMTPITERTECSVNDEEDGQHVEQYKTPSKHDAGTTYTSHCLDLEPLSSPLLDIVDEPVQGRQQQSPPAMKPRAPALAKTASSKKPLPPKGPIIKDAQCNPVEDAVRQEILANVQPPLSSYRGFHDHRGARYEHGGEIRKFIKALAKSNKGSSGGGDKTGPIPSQVTIELPGVDSYYTLKRELGTGAFAPVYLVENSAPDSQDNNDNEDAVAAMGKGAFAVSHRSELEALKMESPPTPWEFHMMRVAHSRLGPQHRAAASLTYAHELHLYDDEAFLFLPYHPHGTLLDVVNFFRGAEPSGVMDEQLAMFFTVELMRTVEALHAKQVLHGDLKPDNCLLRLDALLAGGSSNGGDGQQLSSAWRADGSGGWSARGVVLIDFGRSIDMRAFSPDTQFVADWKTTAQDCAEMREGRPWTWQIDYHGLAGTIHCLLFGKYIETVRCDQGGMGIGSLGGRKYRLRESLKRYWQADLWAECFDVLLNPASFVGGEDGGSMPVVKSLRGVRERMERWLEDNCERGLGLKATMGRLEAFARSRR